MGETPAQGAGSPLRVFAQRAKPGNAGPGGRVPLRVFAQRAKPAAVPGAALRSAASAFPTGVALVTAPGGIGLHIDTFIAASLDPPLIAFSPSRRSLTWRRLRRAPRLGVSVLGAQHAAGLRERARAGADTLAGLDVEYLDDDVPVVRDAPAVLLCELVAEHPAGDHTLAVARVLSVRERAESEPLMFHRGRLGRAC